MTPPPDALRVTVAILTFRRPDDLPRCLEPVVAQAEALAGAPAPAPAPDGTATEVPPPDGTAAHGTAATAVEVLVVDNDPLGSARAYVESVAAAHPAVRYVMEATPGIAAARQRCLDEARDSRLLVFIDDDEEPDPDWLRLMVGTWRGHGEPAAVAGSVLARFDTPPSDFVREGGFFSRARHPTGTVVPAAASGNLLLDMGFLRAHGLGFDRRLGMHGGEDTLLTRQVTAAGGRIVFCREAAIHDLVPDSRNSREWVLARARHMGVTHAVLALLESAPGAPRALTRTRLAAGGLARAGAGCARAVAGTASRSVGMNARGLRMMNRGIGMVRGALTRAPAQYSRG